MTSYIQITKLNDFGFCPHSIYLHSIYESFSDSTYKDVPQSRGKYHHEKIDNAEYSSLKRFLQGTSVYSDELGIAGRIDLLDTKTGVLIDRKYKIKEIFEGYKLQLYAQYVCLREMRYEVNAIKLHSLSDNKRYSLPLPGKAEIEKLTEIINKIYSYNPSEEPEGITANKCNNCIYNNLCVYAKSS